MAVRPTFSGFYTARSGIFSSQAGLDITAHNIANENTVGYTRQRTDVYSVGSNGYKARYADYNSVNIGQGVHVGGISQLRDPGLDIRFRRENTKFAYEDTKVSAFEDLQKIFDETQSDGLHAQLGEFLDALQDFSANADSKELAGIVQNQAVLITKLLNQYSKDLNSVEKQQQDDFKIVVDKINTTLEKVAELNRMIKEDALYGNPALELKDQRNMLLDELSGYLPIEYSYDANDLDELTVNFVDANGNKIALLQGDQFGKLTFNKDDNTVDFVDVNGGKTTLTEKEIDTGAVGAYLDILTGRGAFGDDSSHRGIPYYREMLDSFANTFAETMNELNKKPIDNDGDGIVDGLEDRDLFTSTVPGEKITAGNITISEDWTNDKTFITTSTQLEAGSKANDNILRMIETFSKPLDFKGADGKVAFTGTFQEAISSGIITTIGLDVDKSLSLAQNYAKVVIEIDKSRMSISSVSRDEEAANLMIYQKSYNASARVMTVLDEALDTLINRTGVVGR